MEGLTPDRSEILSTLLDEVTGTQLAINIRQDYCKISDCIGTQKTRGDPIHCQIYFTGSKAEGLDLPGSDEDYMFSINDFYRIRVVQVPRPLRTMSNLTLFYLCTENTHPGFALLRCANPQTLYHTNQNHLRRTINTILLNHLENINGQMFLSSNLIVNSYLTSAMFLNLNVSQQGPSVTTLRDTGDNSDSEIDHVICIHCKFWPNIAAEWFHRPRPYGWPTPGLVSMIHESGCDLVPIGFPNSGMKSVEWRISFSVAERTLVWSFNHVQMQCYAIMKIILRECIKKRCNPQNQILCSYFIKTFLFWKYETTNLDFWRKENLGKCINYLLTEFYRCIREGILRHYFIPAFNLLYVKLTQEAQAEIVQIFQIILQSGIDIFKECNTLQKIWLKFFQADENQISVLNCTKRSNFIQTDECLINRICRLYDIDSLRNSQNMPNWLGNLNILDEFLNGILNIPTKTCLKNILIKQLLFNKHISSANLPNSRNKDLYRLQGHAYDDSSLFETSAYRIYYATMFLVKQDYSVTLSIVNRVLSSIPPFALYESSCVCTGMTNAKQEYIDMFLCSELRTMQRARMAWLFELVFDKSNFETLPIAIKIELYYCFDIITRIFISPFTYMYYLLFICYHELRQFDSRERVLCQLVDVVYDHERCGRHRHHSYNIAGHCLLLAGEHDQAREMFDRSIEFATEQLGPWFAKQNSALKYIEHFYWYQIENQPES